MSNDKKNMITIVGPTASGKTRLAVDVAAALDSEVISADSRQFYRGMDLGTGKDLEDYEFEGRPIPYHLIDIKDAGYKYNIFEFQQDFHKVYDELQQRGKVPVLCGGSGLYVESVLKGYQMCEVPENRALRDALAEKTLAQLEEILRTYKTLHNGTDSDTVKRTIREIEIQDYYKNHPEKKSMFPPVQSLIVGVDIDRDLRRERISQRLDARLSAGMIDEIQALLDKGVPADTLIYYGLEYKYVTLYLTGQLSKTEMRDQLETAIHQFAKRQMTWFRGMERRGFHIYWLDYTLKREKKVEQVLELFKRFTIEQPIF